VPNSYNCRAALSVNAGCGTKRVVYRKTANRRLIDHKRNLRSCKRFESPEYLCVNALYIERYLNFGLTLGELGTSKSIFGIAKLAGTYYPAIVITLRLPSGFTSIGLRIEFQGYSINCPRENF
jgi:hypothetical protein